MTETTLCENCKEEVPLTLYCLNCGFPLYKTRTQTRQLAKMRYQRELDEAQRRAGPWC